MAVNVAANLLSVVHKSQQAVTIAFPDVCKTPSPAGPIPIPYPNIAQTATARQNAAKTQTKSAVLQKPSGMSRSMGGEPGVLKGMVSFQNRGQADYRTASSNVKLAGSPVVTHLSPTRSNQALSEAQQLRGKLNAIHQQMQTLPGAAPDRWQALLQEYAVCASALYMTLLPADD